MKKYPLKLPSYPLQPVMHCHVLQQNDNHKYTKYYQPLPTAKTGVLVR